jgi:hypothetical protein
MFEISFIKWNSLVHCNRYKCKSGTIRKRLRGLMMARASGGEISGIVEFSAAPLLRWMGGIESLT